MKFVEKLSVKKIVGRAELVGASMGEIDSQLFLKTMAQSCTSRGIFFDWKEITIATGSYLQAAFIPALISRKCVVICSDLTRQVEEDLEIVLEKQKLPMLISRKPAARNRRELSILGPLDDTYLETLSLIKLRNSVSATELSMERTDIGKTAWMNRLSRLHEMGLILKEKTGKEFRYFYPDIKEL